MINRIFIINLEKAKTINFNIIQNGKIKKMYAYNYVKLKKK